eukprot:4269046-Pyramimonas_sp.AAC.1
MMVDDRLGSIGAELAGDGLPAWMWEASALTDASLGASLERRLRAHIRRRECVILFMSPSIRGGSQATEARTNRSCISRFAGRVARISNECCSACVPCLVEMPRGNRCWPPLLA